MQGRIIIIISILILLVSCGGPSRGKGTEENYTIAALRGPSAMGMIMLIDSLNRAEEPGIKVQIFDEPIQVRRMMLEGSADFAILPTSMAAVMYNRGIDYKLIAIPVWGTLYLAGSDTTIKNWEDLRNRTVHSMARGMNPDILFRKLLENNNINPDRDITIDYSFPTHIDLANAIAAGRATTGVLSEPFVSLVTSRNSNIKIIFDLNREWEEQYGSPMPQTAFMVKGDLIREKPELVEEIVLAYQRSTNFVNSNPQNAAELIVEYNILPDTGVALSSIPLSSLNFVKANRVKAEITQFLKIFYDMNPEITGGKMPDEEFIY